MSGLDNLSLQAVNSLVGKSVIVIDENASIDVGSVNPDSTILTNRFDIYESAKNTTTQCYYSDFDWQQIIQSGCQHVVYRTSKEKASTYHNIFNAFDALAVGGTLHLLGMKQDGIKTYGRSTAKIFGDGAFQNKKSEGAEWFSITKRVESAQKNSKALEYMAPIIWECGLLNKPGVFSWKSIDKGSQLLIDQLINVKSTIGEDTTWLDIGCGNGFLSHRIFQHFSPKRIVATDNNATAINICLENFKKFNIPGDVVAADVANNVEGRFDYIISNLPFHKGFNVDYSLTEKFLNVIYSRLNSKGTAFIVANKFVPVLKLLPPQLSATKIENDTQYQTFKLSRK